MSRPPFWRSAASEDSEANDVDAGRLVVVIGGVSGGIAIVLLSLSALIRGADPMAFGTGVGAILAGLGVLAGGGGINMLLKGKGEGLPT